LDKFTRSVQRWSAIGRRIFCKFTHFYKFHGFYNTITCVYRPSLDLYSRMCEHLQHTLHAHINDIIK
jgi:hypothetical protein